MELNHFASVSDAVDYLCSELLASLEDDLARMEKEEAQHYTDEDRGEMRDRIADLEKVAPLVCQAFAATEKEGAHE